MYGTNIIGSGLSLGKVLSGLSRGLTIANQVIPLYQQAKPMISNARKVMSVLKEFNTTSTESKESISAKEPKANLIETKEQKTSSIQGSSKSIPVFFQ